MVSFGALSVVSKTINFFIKKTESEGVGVGFVLLSIVFSFWQEMINTVNVIKIVMYFFIMNLFRVCFMAINFPALYAVANFGTDYLLLKIKKIAEGECAEPLLSCMLAGVPYYVIVTAQRV